MERISGFVSLSKGVPFEKGLRIVAFSEGSLSEKIYTKVALAIMNAGIGVGGV